MYLSLASGLVSSIFDYARKCLQSPWFPRIVPLSRSDVDRTLFFKLPNTLKGGMNSFLLGLPLELLQRVVSYLELDDFHSLTETCKELKNCLAGEGFCQEVLEVGRNC